ncbi:CHAT domain-containing protein [Streptomyces fulvoviolaceus]|uniref:CHAT domain-containing protein n=1 Tax=Streptomyces fulvoviolaceus TaxID=285535 RepID=UPI0021BE1BB6|nr:CHAT domain-containing protein [Streptomyces fulvoviolaceus]MCT9081420.1 CHAT domain-containing protein [Streptomyces fulvoviolaceus]
MARDLPVRIVQDPSDGFTRLPARVPPPDLVVGFDAWGDDRILARMHGTAVPALSGTEHKTLLEATPKEVKAVTARLRRLWSDEFVRAERPDAAGRPTYPYATLVDLTAEPEAELEARLGELTRYGAQLLFDVLLGGEGESVKLFRGFLIEALRGDEPLRVRFDSDLFVPWPMLCLPPDATDEPGLPGLFRRFLGHRHRIEQTGGGFYAGIADGRERPPPPVPVVSLNHDTGVDPRGRTRAARIGEVLAQGTTLIERTTRPQLEAALSDPALDEQLMYFWCHGHFQPAEPEPPYLVVKLTDQRPIDAYTVRAHRPPRAECAPFQPFVLLNACYAGMPGNADLAYLGRALVETGARGILGPQMEMPQAFAAEYALEFLTRYLPGTDTAGTVTHAVARHFADELRNPLGLAYALHCGMDARLERARPEETPA